MTELKEPWRPMADAPRDGSTVIVLAADLSCANAFVWDADRDVWLQFAGDWTDISKVAKYTYDEELDGYGWVPGPLHEDASR